MATSTPGRPFREEFRLVKFGLGHPDPDVFVRSQWPRSKWLYILWRTFWFLWHIGWIIASGVNTRAKVRYSEEGPKWFIYLTNTTLLLTTLTSTVDFVIVLYVSVFRDGTVLGEPQRIERENSETPSSGHAAGIQEEIVFRGEFTLVDGIKQHTTTWYLKLVWLLYNIVLSTNIVITILYWALEFDGRIEAVGVAVHAINSVFIILNLLVSALPVQILHVIYPMIYAALYLLFNCIYLISGGTDISGRQFIYTVIDWRKPFPTAIVVTLGVLVAVPLGHLLSFAVYTLRVFIHSKLSSYFATTGHQRRSNRTANVDNTAEKTDDVEMVNSAHA